ncbi:helix-turn-helix transcriptional regulator [Chelativorans sp. YIM 93263]|uniref:helix-turn-helix transcriptional regulator n=1 Tax=Chelativorans sp. YIM 93263 TaxID=2906648 RepID=UPI0023785DBB|nr:LuxR family transcriptional regulator [Chelativorans sp. YIM 93263]
MQRFNRTHAALSYAEDMEAVDCFDQFAAATERAMETFGFRHFVIAELPLPAEKLEDLILLKSCPREWFELYVQNDYAKADPVANHCHNCQFPFLWSDAPYDGKREPRAHEVMSLARDFGMPQGLCVPARSFSRDLCLSVAVDQVELPAEARPALHFVALYAIETALRLRKPPAEPKGKALTGRESEILVWAAAGKSATETADILNITERTVTAHAVNAMNKLGAANKTQAVVRAIQRRYIPLDL